MDLPFSISDKQPARNRNIRPFFIVGIACLVVSCASYYHQHYDFNNEFEKGDLRKALQTLQEKDNLAKGKSQFIYFVNNGLLLSILGEYEESNAYFEKAFLFGEDYRINYLNEAVSYVYNPGVVMYRGEDHEHLMLLYYKALNFLKMNKPAEALVECRRLNIRLNQLSDKYSSEKKYQRDPFIHTLMGIIYQSAKDYNNAFIAYRNAVEIYEEDYMPMFGMAVPNQLKIDLLNTASWTGFREEYEALRTHFAMDDFQPSPPEADLVFFWHNGLAPVKTEWSINLFLDHQNDNSVLFYNESMGLSFPFHVDDDEEHDLKDLEVLQVAFPRYSERTAYFQSAAIRKDSRVYPLELTEDINKIAFHSLRQRMLLEFSKGLLRAAVKKATEHSLRKENEQLGALIGVLNAITEQADTRNWQTLPHSIYYSRVPLQEGVNEISFILESDGDRVEYEFNYTARKDQTLFHTFSSLETLSAPYRMY